MRLYWELANRSLQRHLTYRAAVFAGLVTNFFFGFLRIAILLAIYGQQKEIAGIDIQGGITYMALIQAGIGYLSMFGWYDLIRSIHTGEITAELLKPLNLFAYWMAVDFGRAVIQFIFRGILIIILFELVFDLLYPATGEQWLGLIIGIPLSWLLNFSWRFLINLAAFWTPNALGIGRFFFIASWFFSGFLMPLRYFPDWVIQISQYTPFPSMLNTLLDLSIGALEGTVLWRALGVQVVWIVILIALGQIFLNAGVKRLVILGG